jgi:splicing factor 1
MMKIRLVKIVSTPPFSEIFKLNGVGGQIGHRKYDCPEQRNFTANIICRVCGNAGHMARDCPDRQRGTDSRNQAPGYGGPQRRIGGGDAVDREMEVSQVPRCIGPSLTIQNLMQELSGNPSNGPTARIEAAPGGNPWDQGYSGGGGESARPWEQRAAPSGGAAPWQRDRQDNYGGSNNAPWSAPRNDNNYGGYGAAPGAPGAGGAAPWASQAPPPPPPGGGYGGYAGYPGYDQSGYGAPAAAPPGLSDFLQQYSQQAPPPPPSDIPAPPPDYSQAPPPPPGDVPPPPPPK